MNLTNDQLKTIYHGALWFQETEDGYLQAFQYTKEQNDYFNQVSEFWFELVPHLPEYFIDNLHPNCRAVKCTEEIWC